MLKESIVVMLYLILVQMLKCGISSINEGPFIINISQLGGLELTIHSINKYNGRGIFTTVYGNILKYGGLTDKQIR